MIPMLFIRHYKLQDPYQDYAALDIDQLDALAQHLVDPPILEIPAEAVTPEVHAALTGARKMYCSPSLRARQTAEQLDMLTGGGRAIEVDARLAELTFVPSLLVQSPEEHPLTSIRERLYPAMEAREPHVSDFGEVMHRVQNFLMERKDDPCCVVAHGFLMRLLLAAQEAKSREEVFWRVQKVPPVGYLEVAQISILPVTLL